MGTVTGFGSGWAKREVARNTKASMYATSFMALIVVGRVPFAMRFRRADTKTRNVFHLA
jgi:hypothetical protein